MPDNFFLCHNPLLGAPPGTVGFIYHYDQPRFFASIIEIDYSKELPDLNIKGQNFMFSYMRGDKHERIFVIMVMHSGGERYYDKIQAALKRAASWYANCLNIEDMRIFGKRSSWSPMRDYSRAAPVQVLHIEAFDQWLVSYPSGLAVFDNPEDMKIIIDTYPSCSDKKSTV